MNIAKENLINPFHPVFNIRDDLLNYVETAFNTNIDSCNQERLERLQEYGTLMADPIIELIPNYKQDKALEDLEAGDIPIFETEEGRKLFKSIVGAKNGLFQKDWRLFKHQTQMLRKALTVVKDEKTNQIKPNHCVITSGTGSGKTESFLLPIFAELIREVERNPHQWEDLPALSDSEKRGWNWWRDDVPGQWSQNSLNRRRRRKETRRYCCLVLSSNKK